MQNSLRTELTEIFRYLRLLSHDRRQVWLKLRAENLSLSLMYRRYFLLSVLSALCIWIGWIFSGRPFVATVGHVFSHVVLALGFMYIGAWIVELLAPRFDGKTTQRDSTLLLTFCAYPVLAAGLFRIVPALRIPALLIGLYGFFLYLYGIPHLVSIPKAKHTRFFFVSSALVAILFFASSALVENALPGLYPEINAAQIMRNELTDQQKEKLDEELRRLKP